MPRKIMNIEDITSVKAKELMDVNKEELSEFQKRTYDYVTKFAKYKAGAANKLVTELNKAFEITLRDAIMIVNCAPSSIEELRTILSGKGKVYLSNQLEDILSVIKKYDNTIFK